MGADASVHLMHAAGTSHSSSAPYCGCIATVQPSPTRHHSSSAPPNPLLLPASDVLRVASLLLADVSLLPFNLVGSASSGVVSASNRPPTAPSFAPVTMRCFDASNTEEECSLHGSAVTSSDRFHFVFHRWFDRYFDRRLQCSGDWGMWRNGPRCKEMGKIRHIAHCSTRAVDM